MRIASWNVNGLRACASKGFIGWLNRSGADAVLLQEIKAHPDQLERRVRAPKGWVAHFEPAQRPGYSGVALYSRREPDEILRGLGESCYDCEGRVIAARFGQLVIIGAYFPQGSRDHSRVPFKLSFSEAIQARANRLRAQGLHVVITGDYNTAHREEDLARPKENAKSTGFLPHERAWMDRHVEDGWIDTFRHVQPHARERYTWWSQRFGVRKKNIGWRLDYAFADRALAPSIEAAEIHSEVKGSDHCPVSLTLAE